MPAFSGQDSSRVVSNYWRVADAISSQDMCFSPGIGKGIDFQRGSKGLSAGVGFLIRWQDQGLSTQHTILFK